MYIRSGHRTLPPSAELQIGNACHAAHILSARLCCQRSCHSLPATIQKPRHKEGLIYAQCSDHCSKYTRIDWAWGFNELQPNVVDTPLIGIEMQGRLFSSRFPFDITTLPPSLYSLSDFSSSLYFLSGINLEQMRNTLKIRWGNIVESGNFEKLR